MGRRDQYHYANNFQALNAENPFQALNAENPSIFSYVLYRVIEQLSSYFLRIDSKDRIVVKKKIFSKDGVLFLQVV